MAYDEAPAEHLEDISSRINELTTDSIDYSDVIGSVDIAQKYNAEKKYVERHPQGIHFREVDSLLKADLPVYQEWVEKKKAEQEEIRKKEAYEETYGSIAGKMKDFVFLAKMYEENGITIPAEAYCFDVPDENGKGLCATCAYWEYKKILKFYPHTYEVKKYNVIYVSLKNSQSIIEFWGNDMEEKYGIHTRYHIGALDPKLYSKIVNKLKKCNGKPFDVDVSN